jgi:type I restriction enzyme S subunit
VKFDHTRIDKSYFIFALKRTIDELSRFAHGSTMKHIIKSDFDNHRIPLPPLPDQIRIANILSKAESLIRQRKESLRLLDEFLKSTFLEMFGDPVKNETDRNTKPLGERIRVKHGFAFQSKYFSSSGKYVLLTPGNFREEGGYRDRGDKQKFYIGEIPKKYVLKKGDLLVAMTEQAPGLLGSPIIIPESNKFLHNQRLGLLEFDRKYFNTHFLFYLFNTLSIRRIIHAKATGTKVRHTSPKKLEEIAIQYPPLELQNDFAAIVQKVQALKASNETSLSMLESLFKSLSSKAFKGQLDLKVESGKAESKGVHLYS